MRLREGRAYNSGMNTDGAARVPGLAFPGHDKLVAALDGAVALGKQQAVVAAVRDALHGMIRDRDVRLPACVRQPLEIHYARRELYRSARHGYSVVAMTWGPGQGTPLHDHAGLWCVEGVWAGELEIVQYELLAVRGKQFRLRASSVLRAGRGSAGSLIPPHEYHTMRNPSPHAIAVTLHVYEAPLELCSMFLPRGGEWFDRIGKTLVTDAVA